MLVNNLNHQSCLGYSKRLFKFIETYTNRIIWVKHAQNHQCGEMINHPQNHPQMVDLSLGFPHYP